MTETYDLAEQRARATKTLGGSVTNSCRIGGPATRAGFESSQCSLETQLSQWTSVTERYRLECQASA